VLREVWCSAEKFLSYPLGTLFEKNAVMIKSMKDKLRKSRKKKKTAFPDQTHGRADCSMERAVTAGDECADILMLLRRFAAALTV